ncbi:MAG: hypothetical protein ABEJ65_07755 [bacterium]
MNRVLNNPVIAGGLFFGVGMGLFVLGFFVPPYFRSIHQLNVLGQLVLFSGVPLLIISGVLWFRLEQNRLLAIGSMFGGFSTPLVLGSILLMIFWNQFSTGSEPFNSETWKQAEKNNSNVRQKMLGDLRNQHQLTGKSREEIAELLGPPTNTGHFKNYEMVYWLGPEQHPYGVDSQWLLLDLEDNVVQKVSVKTD